MRGSAVLALWIDIDPAVRDECDAWYVARHIADRIALPGWRRARRFRAAHDWAPWTTPATLAVYEIERPEDLVSEAYLRLQRDVDTTDARMRAAFSNVVRDTFRVRHSGGAGEGGVMMSLRFEPDTAAISDQAFQRILIRELIPALSALSGVISVHLLQSEPQWRARHDAHRKSGATDARAHWVLLVEATERDRAQAVHTHLLAATIDAAMNLNAGQFGIYDLMVAV